MPDPPRIYWDASVFLSYINREPTRLPDIEAYLDRSSRAIQLVTSAISIVEVAFAKVEQDGGVLDAAIQERIDALWSASDSPVRLIEFYPLLALEARALIRDSLARGLRIPRAADAIHLASARRVQASEVHTYDTSWSRYQALLGVTIGPPNAPGLQFRLDTLLPPPDAGDDRPPGAGGGETGARTVT
jgi:predicted nucleic acid-binding protein